MYNLKSEIQCLQTNRVLLEINIPDDACDQFCILVFGFEQYNLKSQKCNDDYDKV